VPGEPRPEGKGRPAADLPSSVSQPASPHPRPPSPTEPTAGPTTEELTEARRHFETALERYSRGQYRGAIAELEQARKLDPEGKDLVYNLALVHEKLGELSTALNYFRLYLQMEDDENERARTEASIIRVEGALAEVDASSAAPAAHVTEGPSYPVVAHLAPGKFDGWVWVTGGVAVAATLVGALLGSKALATAPGDADATAGGRSARDFRQDAHRARAYAVAADVSFGVAAVSGASAAFLYFGRSAEASSGAVRASAHGPVQPLPEPSTILLALSGGLRF
jgi:tetratricopeptide (TPR) repeat protein